MTFNLRKILRHIPAETLKPYLELRGVAVPVDWWSRTGSKLSSRLATHLVSTSGESSEAVLADLVRVAPMATERGRKALINAAADRVEIIAMFAKLSNDFERALWMLMSHPALFREAEELRFFDYFSEGNRGRHYRTLPGLEISRLPPDLDAFKADICQFHRKRDGSGLSCEIEFADRRREGSTQIAVYLQGLPNNTVEFVSGNFQRRISNPALEAAIVYDPQTGETSTVIKGDQKVHEALREAFARRLLKIDPKFDVIAKRGFLLDVLREPQALAPDAALGVSAVRVRRLKLTGPLMGGGALIVEAPAGVPEQSVYDLGNSWFVERSAVFGKFTVVQAMISMHFARAPGAKRAKTLNIELTKPNGSNLKDLPEGDRAIAEAHIAKWNLIEAGG
jgi:hypothetical protein